MLDNYVKECFVIIRNNELDLFLLFQKYIYIVREENVSCRMLCDFYLI